jgi:hypothetical protein
MKGAVELRDAAASSPGSGVMRGLKERPKSTAMVEYARLDLPYRRNIVSFHGSGLTGVAVDKSGRVFSGAELTRSRSM